LGEIVFGDLKKNKQP